MGEIDDLLADLKAEYQQQKPSQPPKAETKPLQKPTPIPTSGVTNMESPKTSSSAIDNLLNEVKSELISPPQTNINQSSSQPRPSTNSSLDSLLESVAHEVKYPQPQNRVQTPSYSGLNLGQDQGLIREIKQEIQEQERIAEAQRQQQLAEAKKQEELRQKRKREALAKEAQEWLKKLDHKSEEGLWFEEFAYSYENKLEAAIDYLAALKEVRAR